MYDNAFAEGMPMSFSWSFLLVAVGLVFVAEGLLPLLSPASWRSMVSRLLEKNDNIMRYYGLASVAIGFTMMVLGHYLECFVEN